MNSQFIDSKGMESIIQEIVNVLLGSIPEEWTKILLYAQVDIGSTSVYFYYYPQGSNIPEYSLDIGKKWDYAKEELYANERNLVSAVEKLWEEFKSKGQEQWTNLTLILDNKGHIEISYDYSNKDDCDPYDDFIIWRYKYLGLLPEKSRKRDIQIIQDYLKKQKKES